MTEEHAGFIVEPDLEAIAFKRFEDPSRLTLEEIRLMCAGIVMELVGQRQRRREKQKLAS